MNYSIIFFVAKNFLVITLLLYRLIVLSLEWAEAKDDQNEPVKKPLKPPAPPANIAKTGINGKQEHSIYV